MSNNEATTSANEGLDGRLSPQISAVTQLDGNASSSSPIQVLNDNNNKSNNVNNNNHGNNSKILPIKNPLDIRNSNESHLHSDDNEDYYEDGDNTSAIGGVIRRRNIGDSDLIGGDNSGVGGGGGGGANNGDYWNRNGGHHSQHHSRAVSPSVLDNMSEISSQAPIAPLIRSKSRPELSSNTQINSVMSAVSRYSNLSYWKARRVVFYRNGDPFFPGVELRYRPGRDITSLDNLLDKISPKMDLPRGARYVFSMDGDRKYSLDELEDGASYVVSSFKSFKVSN